MPCNDMVDSVLQQRVENAWRFAQQQVRKQIERDPNLYPLYTQKGIWNHSGEPWTRWCDGFLPGMMWLFYELEHDVEWRSHAEVYSRRLESRKHDREVHDLGFIFFHGTYLRWYKATVDERRPDESLNDVVLQAGKTLAMRFKEKGQYLRSFVADESLFIDIMMNVPIIFYAALERDDADLMRIATAHTLTSRRALVRGDGSTSHEATFDLNSGECLRQTTHQGYRPDSCWSRGLAWSLYGFATCYKLVPDERFLQTARMNADYYMNAAPADGIAPWDFDAPTDSRHQVDSSAAAIAASGLMELACADPQEERKARYREYASQILATLCGEQYLGKTPAGWQGILKHGVYHVNKNLGVGESVMWGEFFFVEALSKLIRSWKS